MSTGHSKYYHASTHRRAAEGHVRAVVAEDVVAADRYAPSPLCTHDIH
jgi:hypothetical protein